MKRLRDFIETKVLNLLQQDDSRLWIDKAEVLAEIDKLDLVSRAEKVGCKVRPMFECVDKDGIFYGSMFTEDAEKWLKEREAK